MNCGIFTQQLSALIVPEVIDYKELAGELENVLQPVYQSAKNCGFENWIYEARGYKNLEDLADVLEVLQAICVAKGYTLEELEKRRKEKAEERGDFKDMIFLEYVE